MTFRELKEPSETLFEIKESDDFGRYLIARDDIPEKTLILSEIPLMYAPADDHEEDMNENKDPPSISAMLFCLKCCIQLDKTKWIACRGCSWPLCSKSCKSEDLHKENECRVFQENKATFPPPHQWPILYKSVLILRIIIQIQDKMPFLWEHFFTKLEHHNDERRNKDHCISSDKMILENLKYFFQMSNVQCFSEEMTKVIIGVINVNGFCANKSKNNGPFKSRKSKCIFEKASLFAHSCAPNCTWTIDVTKMTPKIKVYASIPIKKNQLITIPYNTRHLFYGTMKRQLLIESVAHFICKCKRCQDPTELGTYMSSPLCFTCKKGFLIPKETSNHESWWICSDKLCDEVCTIQKVVSFVTDIEDQFDQIQNLGLPWNKAFPEFQTFFLQSYGKHVHRNHYILQEISAKIIEICAEKLEQMSKEEVDIYLWHCNYLLKIADVILPGFNGYQEQLLDYQAEGNYFQKERRLKDKKYDSSTTED